MAMADVVTFGSLPIGARVYRIPLIDGEYRGVITLTLVKISETEARIDEPMWAPKLHGKIRLLAPHDLVDTWPMEVAKRRAEYQAIKQARKLEIG